MVLSGDIGIILIAERVIATCKARQYEHHYRKPSLAIIFIVIWILEAGAVTFAEANPWNSSSVYGIPESCTMMLAFCSLILGFASYVTLVIIGYYNITAYHKTLIRPNSHSLTERYQLSENIRTSRQLHPALFLHFLEKFAAIGFVFISYYEIIKDPYWINFIRTLMYVVHGVCNFFIQVTVISYHPFLRRQASHLLSPILSRFKSATVDCDISLHEIDPNRTTTLPKINHALFAINRVQPSQSYSPSNDTDTHFKMLNDYWTVKTKSKT
ncbi:serpentine type 7TM GPCR receptor class ab chemoreceptor domain-containing protein [Ditylenchus destructor]|uniref:Serpentine type 7TM GPCR receptor class ab chemoreceptor domain-containing protein n=1 Tax=Ditylenchus destructor TaxID=166010 RepID=A0AAD4NIK4_9BILA|nr:serpentine type 7TM GPCR receptor class ab chemoreceptor domain-containing protein [Ditylenchus destructor]